MYSFSVGHLLLVLEPVTNSLFFQWDFHLEIYFLICYSYELETDFELGIGACDPFFFQR